MIKRKPKRQRGNKRSKLNKLGIKNLKDTSEITLKNSGNKRYSRKLINFPASSTRNSNAERSASSTQQSIPDKFKFSNNNNIHAKKIREAYFENLKRQKLGQFQSRELSETPSSQRSIRSNNSEVANVNINDLGEIIDHLHMKNDKDAYYRILNMNSGVVFKTSDIFYKIPYLDAILEYSEYGAKSAYMLKYKDVNKIKKKEPVFELIYKD